MSKKIPISQHAVDRFIERIGIARPEAIYATIRKAIKSPLREYDTMTDQGPRKMVMGKFGKKEFWLVLEIDKSKVHTVIERFQPGLTAREVGVWHV